MYILSKKLQIFYFLAFCTKKLDSQTSDFSFVEIIREEPINQTVIAIHQVSSMVGWSAEVFPVLQLIIRPLRPVSERREDPHKRTGWG